MSFWKSMLGKKDAPVEPLELGVLGVDMHSHFIPGIDDGAQNMGESLALIKSMQEFGYRKVITTPHIFSDLYKNSSANILEGLDAVRKAVAEHAIPIEVDAAAEYYLDEHFEDLIERKDILTFGKNYVLFEISFAAEPANLGRAIFNMHLQGYRPVLAHPERYEYWNPHFSKYQDLVDKDVLLQLNINSLTGQYGKEVKRTSERLIDAGLISFIGSDCHHPGHLELMNQARSNVYLRKLVHSGKLLNQTL